MINKNTELAVENFMAGCNCAQTMVKTYSGHNEAETELFLKLAQPFGGGIARTGSICGAVSGALMAIGLKYTNFSNPALKTLVVSLCNKFMDEFKNANCSLICKELLGEDISTEAGHTAIKEKGLREKVCRNLIFSSSEILNKIMLENETNN